MQLFNILLSLIITSSLITASPVDRSLLAKRQDYEEVIVVTVTSAYTITVSSIVPQVTKTVTVHANFGNNPNPLVGVSATTTEEVITPAAIAALTTTAAAAPVADNTPAAVVAPDTTTSSPAAAPSPAVDSAVSSNSASTLYTGQGTYYSTGLGSCGITSADTDFICAIGHALYDSVPDGGNPNNSPFCGRKIKASSASGSVTITIVDRCTGCAEYDLDFSPAAFDQLGQESVGRIPITWEFIS